MLLDVRLPGIDGLVTLQRALAQSPELAVLMMSAHSTVDIAVEAMKHGAIDFLVKPFPFQALDAAVERALASARTRRQIHALTQERRGGGEALAALVGRSAAMEQVRAIVSRLSGSDATTVLVEGESGAGKEVVARAVHFSSGRAERPFLQVNCAALPEHLLESELFGHERGAFTDAHAQKRGLFESAEGGTVMLDEIGDLHPGGQAKLLRLLENKTFRRVGGVTELRADVRVLAATNVNLEERVSEGRFRADLFFRLNVVRIVMPPLREHPEDVPTLCAHFIARFNQEMKRQVRGVSAERDADAPGLPLAGQRPRAPQRHRARLHPPRRGGGAPPRAPAAGAPRRGRVRRGGAAGREAGRGRRRTGWCSRTSSGSSSRRRSSAPAATSRGRRACSASAGTRSATG